MIMTDTAEIDEKVKKSLQGTAFECSALVPISSGIVNWSYRAELQKPLEDGTTQVLVKHDEKFMKTQPEFALTLTRARIEAECFKCLSNSTFTYNPDPTSPYNFSVRTAKFHHFDDQNANQILEYMPSSITLRDFAFKHLAESKSASLELESRCFGQSLGSWLKAFAQWSVKDSSLRGTASENIEGKTVRHMINFEWVFDRMKQYPHLLENSRRVFEDIRKEAAAEMQDESALQVVHGDLGTGNILLPDAPFHEDGAIPIFVIDWEMVHLGVPNEDLGQLIAEMYAIWLYKSLPCGLWIMEGVLDAYGEMTEDFAFRTAVQIGTLIVNVTPIVDWWPAERIEYVVGVGRDITLNAWKRDRGWFETGELACLFRHVRRG